MTVSPFLESTVVRLKSGGPTMVFSHYLAPRPVSLFASGPAMSGCYCVWMDANWHKQGDWFNKDHLEEA